MLELRPVTRDNWRELIKLQVHEDQQHFVASNVFSIAEAQFGDEYEGHWDFSPFGIYDDDVPVGFSMFGLNYDHPRYQAFIIRLMVDKNHQKKGYGHFGMEKMLELLRADERIRQIGISYEAENDVARKLYASLGFVEPGEIVEREVLALLDLRS